MQNLEPAIETAVYEGKTRPQADMPEIKPGRYFFGLSLRPEKPNLSAHFENIKDERQFKALTGVSFEEFLIILPVFFRALRKARAGRIYKRKKKEKTRRRRERKPECHEREAVFYFVLSQKSSEIRCDRV